MKTDTRLSAYALSASAFLCGASSISGQVVHTDLSPDVLVEDLDPGTSTVDVYFDVDGNGGYDIGFQASYRLLGTPGSGASSNRVDLMPVGTAGGVGVVGAIAGPNQLMPGAYIGPSIYFNPNQVGVTFYHHTWWSYGSDFDSDGSASRISAATSGPFYFGFKFAIGTDLHYGWVRLSVNDANSITVEAFAYEATPGVPILAGSEPGNIVCSIRDVSNNGDGSDAQIAFNPLPDESSLTEYRVIVVPESAVGVVDLAVALACPNYESISPSGAVIYQQPLLPGFVDFFGNPFQQDYGYYALILAIDSAGAHILSSRSPTFELSLQVGAPQLSDFSVPTNAEMTGTPADFQLSFEVGDVMDVIEYRAFLVPTPIPTPMDIADTVSLSPDQYVAIPVPAVAGEISFDFGGLIKDTNGDSIASNTQYKAHVWSVAGGMAEGNLVSTFGAQHVNWKAAPVSYLQLLDVLDEGLPSDFRVKFTAYNNAISVLEYRAFIVPDAASFSVSDALLKPPAQYLTFPLYGGMIGLNHNYSQALPDSLLDYEGNAIVPETPYKAFVVSIGAGQIEHDYSASTTVSSIINVDGVEDISIFNSFDAGDVSDITVDFERAPDESNIAAYRVSFIPADSLSDVSTVLAAASDQFVEVSATGAASHSVDLVDGMRDLNGNSIVNDQPYRAVVTSIFDGPYQSGVELKYSDGKFEFLQILTPMAPVSVAEIGDHGNGGDVSINFTVPDETGIEQYRLFAVRQDRPVSDYFGLGNAVYEFINCLSFDPTGGLPGSVHTLPLNWNTKTYHGEILGNGIPYKFYLLSTGAGVSLSVASDQYVLSDDSMRAVPGRIETALDLSQHLYFIDAEKAEEVLRYKVYLRKTDQPLEMFPSEIAELPVASTIFPEQNEEGEWQANLQSAFYDVNGAPLILGEAYECIILTEGKGGPFHSNGFTLVETGLLFYFRSDGSSTGISVQNGSSEIEAIFSGGILQLSLPASVTNFNLDVFNTAGQLIYAEGDLASSQIHLHNLVPGVYLLQIMVGDQSYTARFVAN